MSNPVASDLTVKPLKKFRFKKIKIKTMYYKIILNILQNDVDEPQRSRSYPPRPISRLYTDFFLRSVAARQQEIPKRYIQ